MYVHRNAGIVCGRSREVAVILLNIAARKQLRGRLRRSLCLFPKKLCISNYGKVWGCRCFVGINSGIRILVEELRQDSSRHQSWPAVPV